MSDEPIEPSESVMLRGQAIEEFETRDLLELHEQLEDDLPKTIKELDERHAGALNELELIEDELNRRSQKAVE